MKAKANLFRTLLVLPVVVLVALAGAMAAVAIVSGSGLGPAYAAETSPPTEDVWAWGYNFSGQLGDGTTTNSTTPVQGSGLSGVKDLTGGCANNLAVKDDGTVWAWGFNYYGQLGDGYTTGRYDAHPTPVQVRGLSGVKDVASGCYHSLALKNDGTVWAWGSNQAGELGNGTWDYDAHTTPVKVSGLTGVKEIAGGWHHSLAVKDDGTAWAWGWNEDGQLGEGTTTYRTTPVKVSGLSSVKDLAGGWRHSLALKDDGTVWTWGNNYFGQLGDGTTADPYARTARTTPAKVSGLSGFKDVASGADHNLAVKDDGTVWAWGYNGYGQLGIGYTSTGDSTTPGQVRAVFWPIEFLSSVVDVAGGAYHSLALKDDGTVWTFGSMYGHGSNDNNPIPVQVGGLSGIKDVAAGLGDVTNLYLQDGVGGNYGGYHNLALSSAIPPPTITSPQSNTYDSDGSFSLSGSAKADSTVKLFEGATSTGKTTTADSSSGAWSIALSGVSEGAHTYSAKATDAVAGNTSPASNSVKVTVDKTAPKVFDSSRSPASGATKVARNTSVSATFSEAIDPKTLITTPRDPANPKVGTSTTFTLVKAGTTTPQISAKVSYDDSYNIVMLTPSSNLAARTKYTVKMSGGVKDLAGNALAPYTWSFTTGNT